MLTANRRRRLNEIGPLTYQLKLREAVLEMRPLVVVETGVCNGVSTVLVLEALNENGFGTLYSCDPRYSSQGHAEGRLARAHRKEINFSRWRFEGCKSRQFLPTAPAPWGIFVHDSDHGAKNMAWELGYAWERIEQGGLLVCDDYRWPKHKPHGVFEAFVKQHGVTYKTNDTAAFVFKP